MQEAKVQRAKAKASPQREDFEREFGKDRVKDEPDGSWVLSVKEPAEVRKAYEMQEGIRKIDIEAGARAQARMPRERLIRKSDGRMVEVPEEIIEQTKHKFRPAGKNGLAPAVRFGLSDVFKDFEKGPDGLWFRWDDGWLATNFWRRDAKSPQRDPDGNVWVEVNGEWLLEDEVA